MMDRQTVGRTDRRTDDPGKKKNMSPYPKGGGDIIIIIIIIIISIISTIIINNNYLMLTECDLNLGQFGPLFDSDLG